MRTGRLEVAEASLREQLAIDPGHSDSLSALAALQLARHVTQAPAAPGELLQAAVAAAHALRDRLGADASALPWALLALALQQGAEPGRCGPSMSVQRHGPLASCMQQLARLERESLDRALAPAASTADPALAADGLDGEGGGRADSGPDALAGSGAAPEGHALARDANGFLQAMELAVELGLVELARRAEAAAPLLRRSWRKAAPYLAPVLRARAELLQRGGAADAKPQAELSSQADGQEEGGQQEEEGPAPAADAGAALLGLIRRAARAAPASEAVLPLVLKGDALWLLGRVDPDAISAYQQALKANANACPLRVRTCTRGWAYAAKWCNRVHVA
jgi:hypothetical protein